MKGEKPLVSVAIITYNQKEFLKECLKSVLNQDYKNIEIVVADDGSKDGTHEMLLEYSNKYPNKFKLHLSQENIGITKNSNKAHFLCEGKYIAWMGGDDLMLPGKLTKQVELMEKHSDCTICYHNLDVFQSETNQTISLFNDKKNKIEGNVSKSIIHGTFNGACSTMVRRDKTPQRGFDERIPIASDWLYWIETLASGGKIMYIDEVLGRDRRHSKKIKAIVSDLSEYFIKLAIVDAKYPKLIKYTRKRRAYFYYTQGIKAIKENKKNIAKIYFKECIREDFLFYRAYIRLIQTIYI